MTREDPTRGSTRDERMTSTARTARRARFFYSCAAAFVAISLFGSYGLAAPAPRNFQSFWVQGASGVHHARCARLAVGPHVRVFACPGGAVAPRDAQALATIYETNIYPTDTGLFGTPRYLIPVNVLFVPLDSLTLGYFDQNDVNPHVSLGDPAHSNRANVLYVRYPNTMPDADRLGDTGEVIAHELQHLIEYRLRVVDQHLPAQQDWLNEGLSFYAQLANGYRTPLDSLKVQAASHSPWWPVTSLRPDIGFLRHNARLAYGRAGMFVTYLGAQFGSTFIRTLVGTRDLGLQGIDDVIRQFSRHRDLTSVYADWAVAQYLNDSGTYGYPGMSDIIQQQPTLAAAPIETFPFDSERQLGHKLWLRAWGQEYVRVSTHDTGDLNLSVSGPNVQLRVAAILEDSNGVVTTQVHWLHSNRKNVATFHLQGFGTLYDRVTLAITNIGSEADNGLSTPGPVHIVARLADARHDVRRTRAVAHRNALCRQTARSL